MKSFVKNLAYILCKEEIAKLNEFNSPENLREEKTFVLHDDEKGIVKNL
jgi:hypothetical protein